MTQDVKEVLPFIIYLSVCLSTEKASFSDLIIFAFENS